MQEPKRIPLNPDTPKTKKVITYRLDSQAEYLYDDYGYVTAVKKDTNENTEESTET